MALIINLYNQKTMISVLSSHREYTINSLYQIWHTLSTDNNSLIREYLEMTLKLVPNLWDAIIPMIYDETGKLRSEISLTKNQLESEWLYPSEIAKLYHKRIDELENPPETASAVTDILTRP